MVLYYFFIKRHVETVKPIREWFKNHFFWFSLEYLWQYRYFVSKTIFRFRLENDFFRFWNRFSLPIDFRNVRIFRAENPENDSKRKIDMVIFSTKFFDFRLVKNHFRFSAMKSKNEIFDFDFVRFRKPLKNPVETSFYVLLFIFYLSLEYLWFWNIYTLVFLSLFLLAQNFLVERKRGMRNWKNGGGATIRDTHPGNEK